jgi:hypothetical protein
MLPTWQLLLITISRIMEVIVSLIFPSGQLWFLKMRLFLSFHVNHMIIPGVRIQQRFTSAWSLYFSLQSLIVVAMLPDILSD